jgi:hypothetical protein
MSSFYDLYIHMCSRDMAAQRERQFLASLKTNLIVRDPLNSSDVIPNQL